MFSSDGPFTSGASEEEMGVAGVMADDRGRRQKKLIADRSFHSLWDNVFSTFTTYGNTEWFV